MARFHFISSLTMPQVTYALFQFHNQTDEPVMLGDEPASHASKTKFASTSKSYPSPNLNTIVVTLQHQTVKYGGSFGKCVVSLLYLPQLKDFPKHN